MNRSLDVVREMETGGKEEQRIGAEEKQRKEERKKGEYNFSRNIYIK